jgi:two-component system chemotaxis response regulator CheY
MGMLSIMIVDDEEFLHELYGRILELKGYRVVASARNGEEAVEVFTNLSPKPDLVLMDHRMPIKNGLDAMRDILAIEPDAQVVFLTADSSVGEEALEAGATDIILKPFRMDVLHKTVGDVARRMGYT